MRVSKPSLFRCFLLLVLVFAGSLSAGLTQSQRAWLVKLNRPVRIAVYEGFEPLSFFDDDGQLVGVLPDFANWIEEYNGLDIELIPVAADQIKNSVHSGQVDAAFIYTSDLQDESLIATDRLFGMALSTYVPVDSPIQDLEDLAGRTVAIESDSANLLKKEDVSFEILPCATFDELTAAVESGRADAFIGSSIPFDYYLGRNVQDEKWRFIAKVSEKGRVFLCTSTNRPMLAELLNDAVAEGMQRGAIRNIKRHWRNHESSMLRSFVVQYNLYVIAAMVILLLTALLFWLWDVYLTRHIQNKTRQLRNSEERLRTIFQNSPDAIFIESDTGIVLDANPQACAFHGLSYDELVGKNSLDLVPEDQRESVKNDFPKWVTGELTRSEGISVAAGDREVPVEVIGTPLRYEGRDAVLLLVRDMTERKRAEQALRKSETRYRGLIELQSSLIARFDTEGRFTFVNEALCRFLGQSRAELIGEFFHPFVYYDDLDLPRQAMASLVSEKEKMVVTEHRVHSKTQVAWIHSEASAIFDETGCVVEIQTVAHDITEQRRIYDALQESEKRLRFLFEEIPHIAVQGYNGNHEVIFWNRASEELYGYSRKDALGKKVETLVVPENRQADVAEAIDLWVKTGHPPPSGEMMKKRSDGQMISVYSSRLTTENERGETEIYVIDIDLSELKRARTELVEAKDSAERASRAKSEFLANMSHEIRTPMNGVMGMTHLLLDTGLDEEQRDLTQTILDSTNELLTIIDELLDISRIEAGEVRLQMEPFCPRETVEKVTLLFADSAIKKGVDLSVAVHPDVPSKMMGDAGRIRQVLINLVGNALKFTDHGHIQIRLQAEKLEQGWNLIADVQDTGIGMSPELQKHVFDKFTQGDTSSTREHGGTGLGLAITKQLVELMGGSISVSSEEGQGTTFAFNFILPPLEQDEAVAEEVPVAETPTGLTAEILLVEDNLVNQKVAVALIKKLGCEVTVANNGAAALKVIPDKHFDLIFMDCQMPIMDGFATTRTIRQMVGEIRDIPIVAMTAHALKEDHQKCLDAGMDDYLAKPIHRDKLLAVLQKYCG